MNKILIPLFFLIGFDLFAYNKTEQIVNAKKIAGNTYYIQGFAGAATDYEGFISNAGFVITTSGVVVFDALGTPALADAMIEQIKKLTNQPIKLVLTSHYHADHIYGLASFKKLGAKIWAPKGALDYYQSDNAQQLLEARQELLFPQMDENVLLIKPDKIITQDIEFIMGNTHFSLHYLGAVHSDGDMMLSIKEDKVLFSGDLIFSGRVPLVGDADINSWLKTLDKLQNLSLKYFVPGHGVPANNIKTLTHTTKIYLNYLLEQLTPAVQDLVEFDEIYQAIDWSKFKDLPAFKQANRRNAYSVYLFLERTLD